VVDQEDREVFGREVREAACVGRGASFFTTTAILHPADPRARDVAVPALWLAKTALSSQDGQPVACLYFGLSGTLKTPWPSNTILSPTRHSHCNRTRRPFSVSSTTSTLTSTTSPILTGPRKFKVWEM